jgi:L-ascorbate metabolism protein UlaG (beta-lactamase superfamily)
MRLTKQEHACFIVEEDGQKLVVDPGSFTTPLLGVDDVIAVVITHEHADHWTPDQLTAILDHNPDVAIYGPPGVVTAAGEDFTVNAVHEGDEVTVGPFTLKFFGSKHAVIHSSIPVIDNTGVLINDRIYYAGDSFTIPPVKVDTLAVPAGAPWLKISEVIDYVAAVKPARAFPTHEMVLSVAGRKLSDARIGHTTEFGGGTYHPLEPGDTLEL